MSLGENGGQMAFLSLCFSLLTPLLEICWTGPHSLPLLPTPTQELSFHFLSILAFCSFFCLKVSFFLMMGGGGSLAEAVGLSREVGDTALAPQ